MDSLRVFTCAQSLKAFRALKAAGRFGGAALEGVWQGPRNDRLHEFKGGRAIRSGRRRAQHTPQQALRERSGAFRLILATIPLFSGSYRKPDVALLAALFRDDCFEGPACANRIRRVGSESPRDSDEMDMQ